jgi:hypothetical protein
MNDWLLLLACLGWSASMCMLGVELLREMQRGIRGWRVRREMTRVIRERDREQLEWRRGF